MRDDTLLGLTADSDYVGEYQTGATCAVMFRGDIWVLAGGIVTKGSDVTFNATTGVLSSAATGGAQFAITGAKWLTSAASGALAKVRLSGHGHSA